STPRCDILVQRCTRFTLFPYTTLFRSFIGSSMRAQDKKDGVFSSHKITLPTRPALVKGKPSQVVFGKIPALESYFVIENNVEVRSEEHTSELQSRENLVCRLLLEKKKK